MEEATGASTGAEQGCRAQDAVPIARSQGCEGPEPTQWHTPPQRAPTVTQKPTYKPLLTKGICLIKAGFPFNLCHL